MDVKKNTDRFSRPSVQVAGNMWYNTQYQRMPKRLKEYLSV